MTTIVYRDGILAGDSYHVHYSGENGIPIHRQKVFIEESKLFAYAFCGTYPQEDFPLEQWIALVLSKTLKGESIKPIKEINFFLIIMTRDEVYNISNSNGVITVAPMRNDEYVAYGTGGSIASTALVKGKSALESLERAMLLDTMSGGNIYAVKRSSLRKVKEKTK